MNWITRKVKYASFFVAPFNEFFSHMYGFYLHLRYSFNNKNPGKDVERLRYYLVKHCHIVEKGLSLPEPRLGFGRPKIVDLIEKAKEYEQISGSDDVAKMLRDMLRAYLSYHERMLYVLPDDFEMLIKEFVKDFSPSGKGGLKIMRKESWENYSIEQYEKFVERRCSVRSFSDQPVNDEVVEKIIKTSINM